jgi:predicted sugar kinase
VNPEIEKTLYLVQLQEKEYEQLLWQIQEMDIDPYDRIMKEIKEQQLKWVEQVEDETLRKEILELINIEL